MFKTAQQMKESIATSIMSPEETLEKLETYKCIYHLIKKENEKKEEIEKYKFTKRKYEKIEKIRNDIKKTLQDKQMPIEITESSLELLGEPIIHSIKKKHRVLKSILNITNNDLVNFGPFPVPPEPINNNILTTENLEIYETYYLFCDYYSRVSHELITNNPYSIETNYKDYVLNNNDHLLNRVIRLFKGLGYNVSHSIKTVEESFFCLGLTDEHKYTEDYVVLNFSV